MQRLRNKKTHHHRLIKINLRGTGSVPLLLILLVWMLVIGAAVAHRQYFLDWMALRSYHAPPGIAQLATQDTMTPYARKVFYVNHPLIENKTVFAQVCPTGSKQEQTIVLGCYHSTQAGIFFLQVSDPRLDGVQQVTSAHEMLHAAYDRLSSSDRTKVDAMLVDYYNHGLSDQRILATMAAYKHSEPNDVVNEMHSVFGTEIANLPPGLEQYYKRYFTNREQVASYAAQYQAEFTIRQTAVTQDDAQLAILKPQIDSAEADIKSKQSQLGDQQSQLLVERANNPSAYNAGVPVYNNLVDSFNNEIQVVQDLISRYNQLVTARNAIALEEGQLVNDLSSNVIPASQK